MWRQFISFVTPLITITKDHLPAMHLDFSPSWSSKSFGSCSLAPVSWNRRNWASSSYVAKTQTVESFSWFYFFPVHLQALLDDNFSINSTAKICSGSLHASGLPISTFMVRHRKTANRMRQESCCIFEAIPSNLPIMRRVYVPLIVLPFVFSMPWYKTVMQRSLVLYHGIFHLLLVLLYILALRIGVKKTEKIQRSGWIFHGIDSKEVHNSCIYMLPLKVALMMTF